MGWEFILVPELGNMWLAWWLSLRETAFLLQKSFRTFAFRCVGLYQKDLSEGPTDAAFTNHHVCRPGGRHVWWDARLKIVYFKHSWPGGHWWGGVWFDFPFYDGKKNQPFWTKSDTWLILPVVICLSQRLSHACLSISVILWNCEWLIKSAIVYLVVFTTRITVVILELIRA